jgi:hypothetical protein
MANKHDLPEWIVEALTAAGGSASLVNVCRHVWQHHEQELLSSGDFFFTWQYDIRWAATELRHAGILKAADLSPSGVWELVRVSS